MNDIIQYIETMLQAAKDIQAANLQLNALPGMSKRFGMAHHEQSGHKQDLLGVEAGNLSVIKHCIKEIHEGVRAYEVRNVKHKTMPITTRAIFIHSNHNSMVENDNRA